MNKQAELRSEITNKIIESLENNVIPWRKPWSNDPNCGFPTNLTSKKCYRGINPLLLELTSMMRGYTSKWWGTYKQWQALGGQVSARPKDLTKGDDWGTRIIFYKKVTKESKKEDEKDSSYLYMTSYVVFNLDQVEGEAVEKYRPLTTPKDCPVDYAPAKAIVDATGAEIRHGGNRAAYMRPIGGEWPNHTDGDYIMCPVLFCDPRSEYETKFHELAHWSEVRLGWTGTYEEGELRAEMAACFMSSACGIPHSDDLTNHTAYLKSWLKKMKDDPNFIIKAAKHATEASNYLLGLSHAEEDGGNEEPEVVQPKPKAKAKPKKKSA